MQIRIRDLYRAAPETVQRATHAFAAPIENMGIDHSRVFRLRPCRRHAFSKKNRIFLRPIRLSSGQALLRTGSEA
ncbi:MAG: hypothetical protein FVQ84_19015 [Planctomycetes bacterium]|nr:hypothetical protein [Planctomycetota bacterium]